MKEPDKGVNFGALDQRDRNFLGGRHSRNSQMSCLAQPASRVFLAVRVDVARGSYNEEDGECAQRERKKASTIPRATRCPLCLHEEDPPRLA